MIPRRDLRGLLKEGATLAGGRGLLIGASFVSSVVVTRTLSVDDRGRFGLLMAVGMLAVQFGNLGLPVANTYLLARMPALAPVIFSNTLRVATLAALGLGALCWWGIPLVSVWRPLHGGTSLLVWLCAVTGLAQLLVQNLLIGRFHFSLSNWVDAIARIGAVAGMVALWWFGAATAPTYALNAAILSLFAAWWGLRAGGIAAEWQPWDAKLARRQLQIGVRAYGSCVAAFILSRLPLYAAESRGGLEGLAFYSQALTVGDTMLVIPAAFGTVLFPNLVAMRESRNRVGATLRMVAITGVLMLAAAAAALLLGPLVLPLVYGKAYAASMPVLTFMLPGIVALGMCSVVQNALSANGYPWSAVLAPVFGAAATAAVLMRVDSVNGCAVAYSVGAAVMLLCATIGWWMNRHRGHADDELGSVTTLVAT